MAVPLRTISFFPPSERRNSCEDPKEQSKGRKTRGREEKRERKTSREKAKVKTGRFGLLSFCSLFSYSPSPRRPLAFYFPYLSSLFYSLASSCLFGEGGPQSRPHAALSPAQPTCSTAAALPPSPAWLPGPYPLGYWRVFFFLRQRAESEREGKKARRENFIFSEKERGRRADLSSAKAERINLGTIFQSELEKRYYSA